jgi:hypothetical protein
MYQGAPRKDSSPTPVLAFLAFRTIIQLKMTAAPARQAAGLSQKAFSIADCGVACKTSPH